MVVKIIILLSLSVSLSKGIAVPISAEDLRAAMGDNLIGMTVDFRTNSSRQTEGLIDSSIMIPEDVNLEEAKNGALDDVLSKDDLGDKMTVIVADNTSRVNQAESILSHFGFSKIRSYLGSLKEWEEVGGSLRFPRFVTFEALNSLLDSNSITLIDVRNRTELNTVGQIPGSVCLPLHEVPKAMEMTNENFQAKYGFKKPETTDKKVVLTCRSGKRVLVADEIMKSFGYNHLRIYSGSFLEWTEKGGKVITGTFDLDYES